MIASEERNDGMFYKLGRNIRNILFTVTQAARKKNSEFSQKEFNLWSFRTPVGRSTTELQETRGRLAHITRFKCDKHPAYG